MKIVTGENQLKVGDSITIIGKSSSDNSETTVKQIVNVNGDEEVIFDLRRNRYFITKLLVSGWSWAKEVRINNTL